ncbi:UNVERIFIED_CONTAM: Calmodulin-binding transcription activator 2 [Sesamum angustifolium]|uniref:Calmodulin-binding transcription activator 2 n=1 Tax=Sesamum angustifolium TaxID=2727405 RepID=A0AAW2J8U5_9LAMI
MIFRLEVLMYCIVTMLMEKRTKIFNGVVTGCLKNMYQGQFSAIPGMSSGSVTHGEKNKDPMDNSLTYQLHGELEFPSWGNVVESSNAGYQSVNFQPSHPSTQSSAMSLMPGQENELLDQIFTGVLGKKQNFGSHSGGLEEWQAHVRGHQVRKNYRKIIWSVGILDKVILRWRRKGRFEWIQA